MFDLKMLGAGVAVAAAVVMAPSSAQAITLTADDTTQYDVTTIDAAFALAISQLVNTPWWDSGNTGGSPLAQDLAGKLNTQLPSNNVGNESAYFAFALNDDDNDGIFTVSAWNWDADLGVAGAVELDVENNVLGTSYTWAVGEAAAVPTPALLPAMLGMGASIVRKRKKQASA